MAYSPTPFFSIVLPTWNRAAMLRDALASLRDQTFGDFEVIVVDNHSTDETRSVVDEFKDARFIYHYPEKKLSQLDCYAYGWKLARGLYSGSLDDDNVLRASCLKKVHEVLSLDPAALLCFERGLIYHVADHPNARMRNTLDIHGFSGEVTRYEDGPERIRTMCE